MEIIIIVLLAFTFSMSWIIWNLLTKLEKLEDLIQDYEEFINRERIKNESLLEALRQIDNRQMFEKDDDVGSIFYQIKETIERFKQF